MSACVIVLLHVSHLASDQSTCYPRKLVPLLSCLFFVAVWVAAYQNDERFAWKVDAHGMPERAKIGAHAGGMTGAGASHNRQRRLSIEHRSAVIRRSSAAGLGPRAVAELADTVAVSAAVPQIQIVCVPLVSARGACLGVLQARRYTDPDSNDAGSGPFVAHEELVLAMSCVFISSGT